MSVIEKAKLLKRKRMVQIFGEYEEIMSEQATYLPQRELAVAAALDQSLTLIVIRLNRLTRDPDYLQELFDKGLKIKVIFNPSTSNEDLKRLAQQAFSSYYRKERNKEYSLLGRRRDRLPIGGAAADLSYRTEEAEEFARTVYPIILSLKRKGICSSYGIARKLNELGVKTRRSGQWQANSVNRILQRIQNQTANQSKVRYPRNITARLARCLFTNEEAFLYWKRYYH